MSYDVWRNNTREYRGYTIMPGAIYNSGNPVILFYCSISTKVDDIMFEAKAMIDKHIEREKQNEHSRNN